MTDPRQSNDDQSKGVPHRHRESPKETLISIVIAFVLAFVFRGFVGEAFVIPTGSMAPTLMGAHMQFRSPQSGYAWAVAPRDMDGTRREPLPVQGQARSPIRVHDPMTGFRMEQHGLRRRAGDRILVQKYLYALREPRRFEVAVFKNPGDRQVNFIKRLIGLPGEQVALVDGDVFVRDPSAPEDPSATNLWAQPGWRIARKPPGIQRAVWQPVFDSGYAPLDPSLYGRHWYDPPWESDTPGWDLDGRALRYAGDGPTQLRWNHNARRFALPEGRDAGTWVIDDSYPYNETSEGLRQYPVSDIRLRAGIEPEREGLRVSIMVTARQHEFEAVIDGDEAVLRKRLLGQDGPGRWTEMWRGTVRPLAPGRVTDVEFWHVDQSLRLWINGTMVGSAEYDWSIRDRLRYSTGMSLDRILARGGRQGNVFADLPYRQAWAHWSFAGGPVTLHRVGLDRDIYYQPGSYTGGPRSGTPALGTHPDTTPTLTRDQFFALGDNSPNSSDSRLWDGVDPWISHHFPGTPPGLVPRQLMLGKAFFVYFPAVHWEGNIPMPDFGRMRFIH